MEEEGEIICYLISTNSKGKKTACESQVLGNTLFFFFSSVEEEGAKAVGNASGFSNVLVFVMLCLLLARVKVHRLSSLNFRCSRLHVSHKQRRSKYKLYPS